MPTALCGSTTTRCRSRRAPAADDDRVEVLGDQRGGAEEQPALHDQPGRGRVLVGDGPERAARRLATVSVGCDRAAMRCGRPPVGVVGRFLGAILGHTGLPDPTTPIAVLDQLGARAGGRGRPVRVVADGRGQRAQRRRPVPSGRAGRRRGSGRRAGRWASAAA